MSVGFRHQPGRPPRGPALPRSAEPPSAVAEPAQISRPSDWHVLHLMRHFRAATPATMRAAAYPDHVRSPNRSTGVGSPTPRYRTCWPTTSPAAGGHRPQLGLQSVQHPQGSPLLFHRTKYRYTVCQGGKSAGNSRHARPVRTTYSTASTIFRRASFSGRPPLPDGGSSGSTSVHSSSMRPERGTGATQSPGHPGRTDTNHHAATPTEINFSRTPQSCRGIWPADNIQLATENYPVTQFPSLAPPPALPSLRLPPAAPGAVRMTEPLHARDPRSLGRYRLTGRLGRGGMGTVCPAEAEHGTQVAIKVINPPPASDPNSRDRFRHEVEAARKVHPFCTAPALDTSLNGHRLYVATEYIADPTLVTPNISAHGERSPKLNRALPLPPPTNRSSQSIRKPGHRRPALTAKEVTCEPGAMIQWCAHDGSCWRLPRPPSSQCSSLPMTSRFASPPGSATRPVSSF
jgi:hypothetical protein